MEEEECSNQDVQRCYAIDLPISKAKYKDLKDLCKTGIIPHEYHAFYDSIASSDGITNRLPEPDMDDIDDDLKEEES